MGPPVKGTNTFVPPKPGDDEKCDPSDPNCTVDDQIREDQCTYVIRAQGSDPLYLPRPCGRQSWRQIR
jgi:type IV pilus assembly protein PilY1